MEHDSPSLLFTLACEHLKSSRVIRPGVVVLLEHVATAQSEAGKETYSRVAYLLTPKLVSELDGLLPVDAVVKGTRLSWLTTRFSVAGADGPLPSWVRSRCRKWVCCDRADDRVRSLGAADGQPDKGCPGRPRARFDADCRTPTGSAWPG